MWLLGCRWESVAKAARKALGMRYRLLPYLYSAFYSAHTQGGSVAKPLFFPFPDDATAR
jgi:alpha-glucosidase (family GH31 glycosyl hydrolase)